MFEDLVQFDPEITDQEGFVGIEKSSPQELLDAQVATADWLTELGAPPAEHVVAEAEKANAREAFRALTAGSETSAQREQLARLKTPEAVRHLTGMLTAYDWEFIEYAKELRGYAVAKIVEETRDTNPKVRLQALSMLGKVTEVGLFTEKIEVKKVEMSDAELEQRIKDKLKSFMNVVEVVEVVSGPAPADLPDIEDAIPRATDTDDAT